MSTISVPILLMVLVLVRLGGDGDVLHVRCHYSHVLFGRYG